MPRDLLAAEYWQCENWADIAPTASLRVTRYAAKFIGGMLVPTTFPALTFGVFRIGFLCRRMTEGRGFRCNSVVNVHNFLRLASHISAEIGVCERNVMLEVDKPVAKVQRKRSPWTATITRRPPQPSKGDVEGSDAWRDGEDAHIRVRRMA